MMSVAASSSRLERPILQDHNSALLNEIIHAPGAVNINVQGAFIVDEDESHGDRLKEVGAQHDTKDIRLPHQKAVVSHVALDIGGSLAKLVYFTREPQLEELGGRLNFVRFETDSIVECFTFVKELKSKQQTLNDSQPNEFCVLATGGGAYKYYEEMKQIFGVEILQEDEMECLTMGLDFFISEIPREVFTYNETESMQFQEPRTAIYPYLLVNIGSGVSMVKVSSARKYERIGGTSLGGGTLWGLLSLLTGSTTFDDMLAMADKGNNNSVDMLVGDIYGTDYSKIGLKTSAIASSFGKVFKMKRRGESDAEDGRGLSKRDERPSYAAPAPEHAFKSEDISRSLLYAVSNNIGQIAYLQCEKHQLERIYFGGSFIRGHRQIMNTLSYAIKFWSSSNKKAYFLRHEGYLGSVGAFLKRQPRNWGRRNSLAQ